MISFTTMHGKLKQHAISYIITEKNIRKSYKVRWHEETKAPLLDLEHS